MPTKAAPPLVQAVERYYTDKAARHGATPAGADWSSGRTQQVRFEQLLSACPRRGGFSLNDFGCGYGALLDTLAFHPAATEIDYLGIDVSQAMIELARGRYPNAAFVRAASVPRTADYTVASGVFNVKLSVPLSKWTAYVASALSELFAATQVGLAVNFLSPSQERSITELYRPDPQDWTEYFTGRGARVELLAGYGLPEYTLVIRR